MLAKDGSLTSLPVRAALRWYVGHSAVVAAAPADTLPACTPVTASAAQSPPIAHRLPRPPTRVTSPIATRLTIRTVRELLRSRRLVPLSAALLGPACLTAVLVATSPGNPRDYVYLYLGVVALLGVASGVAPAVVAAAASFLLVDFSFVPPYHTLQFAQPRDLLNLCVFTVAALFVGTIGSRRRAAQLRSEALTRELRFANAELTRLSETERQMHVLEQADRMRDEMLANVSHELRTPL